MNEKDNFQELIEFIASGEDQHAINFFQELLKQDSDIIT